MSTLSLHHAYTSTACQHFKHADCRRNCKFCAAACRCDCHGPAPALLTSAWEKPAGAVEPANPFHTLYMRSTEVSDNLLAEMPALDPALPAGLAAGELLGMLAEFANFTGSLTRVLEEIRRDHPAAWRAWERAWSSK